VTATRESPDELVAVGPGRAAAEPASTREGRPASRSSREASSYRDPAGFVFRRDGVLYRQINASFADRWADLTSSGLLAGLQASGLLVGHEVAPLELAHDPATAVDVIRPELVDFVSYPYEWSFGALRDAALLTLDAQAEATKAGFVMRDASAYNVQFRGGRPMLIDTLSFERAEPDAPWVAYRQFCQHFLAPLALMAYRDPRCGLMLRDHLDGIPLDLAATLLPGRTRLRLGLGSHLHAHARAQRHHAGRSTAPAEASTVRISPLRQAALLDSLRRTVEGLSWDPSGTEWAEYADAAHPSYPGSAAEARDQTVRRGLDAVGGRVAWDLGANTGRFSRIAVAAGYRVVAWDIDPAATERHYRDVRHGGAPILPLLGDLAEPRPALGWGLTERRSMLDRANADVVLAMALVHHLAIGRNVPLPAIADLFAGLARDLIIEFVPREDPMVQRLLASREDVFAEYDEAGFRAAFGRRFAILDVTRLPESPRSVYRMIRRD
jgi:hypothetical protein